MRKDRAFAVGGEVDHFRASCSESDGLVRSVPTTAAAFLDAALTGLDTKVDHLNEG
jgi:hypothetical protein